ncbi:MAG: Gfo/Idh/MocA family oxidoreductase [Planctomycetaceae bacterium]
MSLQANRRDFLKQSTALGVAWWVGSQTSLLGQDSKNPLERLNFACIGVDGKGASDTADAAREGTIVALCDIDDQRLQKAGARYRSAETFHDYREMLARLGDKIDAVTVSTPDHSHAPAASLAMSLGKHCFCQKPLTWAVHESDALRELATKKKLATQMGNQGTASTPLREAVEVVRSGAIGNVTEVHIWSNRPIWPQGLGRPTEIEPVPAHIHWDLFLGPAPERPYNSKAYQPFRWRGWLDFGTGALGDMACHTMNMPVMALELFDPTSVTADSTGIIENETWPKSSTIEFQFPARGDRPACKMVWYDGSRKPDPALLQGAKMTASGALLIGDAGTLYAPGDYAERYQLLPGDKFAEFKKPEPSLPRSPGHFREFGIACRGGEKAMSNFDYAGRLTATQLLGNVALRVGGKIEWDAKSRKITNAPEANQFLTREYREGFGLHGVEA